MIGKLPSDARPWPERRDAGLANATMRETLGLVTRRFSTGKRRVFLEDPAQDQARRAGVQAKRAAIADLDRLIAQFSSAVEAHGGVVRRAATAEEAVEAVKAIARQHQVQVVVKSKSMLTEEIQLNHGLEAAGIRVLETDLGEYIIQRAHETPSHILAPAAHKNRAQIRSLFETDAAEAGLRPPPSDAAETLTQYARERLRREFLEAGMGVTGANFGVAETGTVVLVTNEGNADLVASLPRVLVTVMGIEKLVARWEDLTLLIQQPAMNGIGQRLSAYTTLISGPAASAAEGPAAWYVVLVDNGRSRLRQTVFEDVLSCIRCGACLNVCPVFRQVGGHAYGSVYSGPIGVVETPLLTDFQVGAELPSVACTMCHACQEACPMDIRLAEHIVRLRQEKVRRRLNPPSLTASYHWWSRLWSTPEGYRRSLRLARAVQGLYRRQGRLVNAPGLARGWFQTRDMPPVAKETFLEWWARHRGGAS
ncbi:MAG: LUD domain-containing protein [Firmicutes bacterium]|nr:LUD domain-containing protein [Bacillota bacterium]